MAQKEGDVNPMLIRDIELESMASKKAKEYIGKQVFNKTAFHPEILPLFAQLSEENYLGDSDHVAIQTTVFTRVK